MYRRYIIAYLIGICYCQTSYKDFPEECYSVKTLDDESRSFENFDTPTAQANDINLKKGWYRVLGKAGNSLQQGYERPLQSGRAPPNFCGTENPGLLQGEHPTVEEGLAEMTVCFRNHFCFYKGANCDCENNQTIYVRNCEKFYVYWLSPTSNGQRFCTGKTSLDGPKVINGESQAVECTQHQVIDSGATRVWNQLAVVTCDQNIRGWYRMPENSGGEIASTCSTNNVSVSRLNQPCGASFRGRMPDRHPSLEDGRVQRRICFSYASECTCEFFTNIYVRNCGKFYVYRLNGVPVCNARYCGNLKNSSAEVNDPLKPVLEEHKNLCEANYNVLHDPDRLWSYTSPTVMKCDARLYGVYRFGSKYTPWRIHEGCTKNDLGIITHRCGSDLPGYMEGVHPLEKEGIVDRVICFQSAKVPCECRHKTKVKVQNCGKFYVYKFEGVPSCSARFCMVANNSKSITIDPDQPPLYEIPAPGYTPEVAKKVEEKDDNQSGLIATTAVLSIILLIVIILLILVILLLIFVAWPIYKERQRRRNKSDYNLEYMVAEDPKPSTSNGNLMKGQHEEKEDLYFHDDDFSKLPSAPPRKEPPQAPGSDSIVDMKRGPGSDDDLNTIPEDTEYSDMNDENDTLIKKGDINKPQPYDQKNSAV